MTPKDYLNQIKIIDVAINTKNERLEILKEYAMKITVSQTGGCSSYNISDKVGNTVAKMVDLENIIRDDIDKLADLQKEIYGAIAKIEDINLRTLLELKYIHFKTFEEIAVKMGYSWRHTIRLHGAALEKIQDVMECHIKQ